MAKQKKQLTDYIEVPEPIERKMISVRSSTYSELTDLKEELGLSYPDLIEALLRYYHDQ